MALILQNPRSPVMFEKPAATHRKYIARFHKRYTKDGPSVCWLWTWRLNHDGYGLTYRGSDTVGAHRLSWEIHRVEIPKGMSVLHRCDVRNCVNPEHLRLGMQRENME